MTTGRNRVRRARRQTDSVDEVARLIEAALEKYGDEFVKADIVRVLHDVRPTVMVRALDEAVPDVVKSVLATRWARRPEGKV